MINQDDFTAQRVRFKAIKYLGSGWKEESIEAILDIFVFDYNETQKQVIMEDAKIWMMLTNWSTLFGNMMSAKQNKEFKIKTIMDLIGTAQTQKERKKEKEEMRKFSERSDFLVKVAGEMYSKQKKK